MPILRNPDTGHRAICEDGDVGRLTALGFRPETKEEAKAHAKAEAKAANPKASAKAAAGDQKD